jgi:hypothetical protein
VPLLALKHAQLLLCDLLYSPEHLYSTAFPLPERSSSPDLRRTLWPPSIATHAVSHPRSSAPRAPPQPTGASQPAQSRSRAPERPDHYAGELELPPPLGLAVVPSIHRPVAPAKPTISTTSLCGSSLTTCPLPSSTPATRTPSTSLEPMSPAPVRHRYAASAPLFPDTGHPRDRRETLSISPHLPLAAGELSRRNLIGINRTSCVVRPGTQLQSFKTFQGPFCRKPIPLSEFKSVNL